MNDLEQLAQKLIAQNEQDQLVKRAEDRELINKLVEIYDQKHVADALRAISDSDWTRESLNRWLNGKTVQKSLTDLEVKMLNQLLPEPPEYHPHYAFQFIDLFAGIGGIRKGFEDIGGQCVFTSEWNKEATRTYKANWYCDPEHHKFNSDICDITLSNDQSVSEKEAYRNIDREIPDHDVLLAGFPCQPFSLAGVSKKNSLGRAHGFECETQGTLFFDVARIIAAKKPSIFLLENVKNLKSHDKGKTFRIIMQTLNELGYVVADADHVGSDDPKIIDGKNFLPQHRERIVLIGFRRDLNIHSGFTLKNINQFFPSKKPTIADLLDEKVDSKYILTPALWKYLYYYAKKHQAKGNGFGFGLVSPSDPDSVARTLSARYHKDGSEILIDRGWNKELGEYDFDDDSNQKNRPRRLTPRECARLMGFESQNSTSFRIPVSDTQAYRQFGNSVVVPVFVAIAKLLKPYISRAVELKMNKKVA